MQLDFSLPSCWRATGRARAVDALRARASISETTLNRWQRPHTQHKHIISLRLEQAPDCKRVRKQALSHSFTQILGKSLSNIGDERRRGILVQHPPASPWPYPATSLTLVHASPPQYVAHSVRPFIVYHVEWSISWHNRRILDRAGWPRGQPRLRTPHCVISRSILEWPSGSYFPYLTSYHWYIFKVRWQAFDAASIEFTDVHKVASKPFCHK
jgi:hypothetical protein